MSEKKTILLRLNPLMWEEINRWAAEEFRSVNGQIEYALQEALKQRGRKVKSNEDKNIDKAKDKDQDKDK
jgi:hypothetical protein